MLALDELKVVIAGDHDVGKTSLLCRLRYNRFSDKVAPTYGTAAYRYSMKNSKGKPVTLVLWDTAGQEQYHGLSKLYFRDSTAAIIVFDVSKPNAVDRVMYWVNMYREVIPDGFFAVAGNKSDLLTDDSLTQEELGMIEAQAGVPVALVSAVTSVGVTEMFQFVTDSVSASKNRQTSLRLADGDARGCC